MGLDRLNNFCRVALICSMITFSSCTTNATGGASLRIIPGTGNSGPLFLTTQYEQVMVELVMNQNAPGDDVLLVVPMSYQTPPAGSGAFESDFVVDGNYIGRTRSVRLQIRKRKADAQGNYEFVRQLQEAPFNRPTQVGDGWITVPF